MIPATPWLDALKDHLASARQGGEEDVHQLRVATRRLSSWLKLARMRTLRSDLRWLRAAGGGVRDIDVVLGRTPPEPWAAWLREERAGRLSSLFRVVAAPRAAALCAALELLAPVDEDRARQVVPRLARGVLAVGEQIQVAPHDVETFHQLRRSVRALRYALEWLDEKTGGFKEFQDLSGTAADLSVSLLLLDASPHAVALADHRRQLEEEFTARRLEAVGAWPRLRERIDDLA